MSTSATIRPVFVFGISGASWDVVESLSAEGRLPNISRLRAEGVSGVLQSLRVDDDKHFRPQTAWPTLASGVHPEKHGVTRFYDDARDAKAPMIWDIYQQHGKRVGLFGWPVTWPPKPTDGFAIPSHLGRDAQTWPPELGFIKALDRQQQSAERGGTAAATAPMSKVELGSALLKNGFGPRSAARMGIALAGLVTTRDAEKRALLLRHAKLDLNADLFLSLAKRYGTSFSAFTTFLVDLVSHRYWRYREPELFGEPVKGRSEIFRDAVTEAYAHTDAVIGRVMAAAPRDAVIAVVSEHGMAAEPESTELGKWRYVIRGDQVLELVGVTSGIDVCPVARWIAFRFKADRAFQADVAERMRQILVKETQLPLFQVHIHQDDEVIVKFNLHRGNTTYLQGDFESLTISCQGREVPFTALTRRLGRQRSGMHDGRAVLVLRGPGIAAGRPLPNTTLVDFMPTLLYAGGLPVPTGIDGTVLDIFA